jgi:hypothetical protein
MGTEDEDIKGVELLKQYTKVAAGMFVTLLIGLGVTYLVGLLETSNISNLITILVVTAIGSRLTYLAGF